MIENTMEYKGCHAEIKYDDEMGRWIGRIAGIKDFVDFEAEDISDAEKEFHNAVDDYLEFSNGVRKNG